jgi:hypothetical protein
LLSPKHKLLFYAALAQIVATSIALITVASKMPESEKLPGRNWIVFGMLFNLFAGMTFFYFFLDQKMRQTPQKVAIGCAVFVAIGAILFGIGAKKYGSQDDKMSTAIAMETITAIITLGFLGVIYMKY